jgi:hypothetical protein
MAKVIRYSVTYLGTIKLDEHEKNLTETQIEELIAEDLYDNYNSELEYANDVEYEMEEI